jgi:hypothetical protein
VAGTSISAPGWNSLQSRRGGVGVVSRRAGPSATHHGFGVVGAVTLLQVGRSRVRNPVRSSRTRLCDLLNF